MILSTMFQVFSIASILFFLFPLFPPSQQDFVATRWKMAGKNKRFDKSPLSTSTMSISHCAATCLHHTLCASFNHNDQRKECQLLMTVSFEENDGSLIDDQGWIYYKGHPPPLPLDPFTCPQGTFLLPYDMPGYLKLDPEDKGYTCSGHNWIAQQHNDGKTDCRLVIMYNTEFRGEDISAFKNDVMDYKAAMAQCPDFNCIGMICIGPTDPLTVPTNCWMKQETHLTISKYISSDYNLQYWYTECHAPTN